MRTNGLLAVELFSGECFFKAEKTAKIPQVAQYFYDMAVYLEQKGYTSLDIFLDGNATHKTAMQQLAQKLLEQRNSLEPITLRFHFFPPYSPQMNLTEYLIHLIRQKYLHHADAKQRLIEVEQKLESKLHHKHFLTKDQIINILQHIQDFVT